MNYNRPELLDRLASEYVLGTLRGPARRRFEGLLRSLPAARAAVHSWETRLSTLALSVPPVAPPAQVWQAIDARTQTARPAQKKAISWTSLWKPALGFAFGAALTVGLVQWMPGQFVSLERIAQQEQALPQSYVGLLTDAQNQPTVLVSSTRHGRRVSVKFLRPVTVPAGKRLQVWALPKDGAPFPLGTAQPVPPPGKSEFELSASSEQLLSKVPELAVSFEDASVQAGAAPSAFVLRGFCVKLW